MSDSTVNDNRPGAQADGIIDRLDHLTGGPRQRRALDDRRRPGAGSAAELRRELDVVRVELLTAVDAVAGAEAERSAAKARIRELEHQHYMLKVECSELRREIALLTTDRSELSALRMARRVGSMVRRSLSGG
jgi:chromosome segregation ATPase